MDTAAPPQPQPPALSVRRLVELAEQHDWAAICDMVRAQPPDRLPPQGLFRGIQAALATGEAPLLEACVVAAMSAEMPRRVRALIGVTLARAGESGTALTMLAADPGTVWDLEARRLVTTGLAIIAMDQRAAPVHRAAASALERRRSTNERAPCKQAPFVHAQPASPAGVAHPTEIRLAPGVDAGFAAELRRLIAEDDAARHEPPGAIEVFEDVFVNRTGEIWRPNGQILGDSGALAAGSGAAMATAPWIAAGIYATGATNNLYHWLGGRLPDLAWREAPGVPSTLPVLLRDDAHAYQTESMTIGFEPAPPVLSVGDAVRVGALYRSAPGVIRFDPNSSYQPLLARMIAAAEATSQVPVAGGLRLYLSRRDASQRQMANEAQLEAVLAALGFVAVTMTGRPLTEQIRIVRAASAVVSPHGAGLSLLLFARPGTAVFEMIPAMPRSMTVRLCMTAISRARGHRHMAWIEPCNEVTGAWSCAIPQMLPALEAFLDGR